MLSAGLIFGSLNKNKDYSVVDSLKNGGIQGNVALYTKDFVKRVSDVVGGINGFIGSTRHLHAQVLPALKVLTEGTRFSRLALPGLAEGFLWAINVSDFFEFIGDTNYVLNGGLSHDVSEGRFFAVLTHACGATADVTNTIELIREWGGHQLSFLGQFGNSVASFSVYGSKPFAFAAGVSVSGVCSFTLCSLFFFNAIDSYRKMGREQKKVDAAENNAYAAKHTAKKDEAMRTLWMSGAKCALYTTLLGLQVSNVFVLGALGSLAFATAFSLQTYKNSVV